MRTLYWIIGGVVVVLCVAGLIAYTGAKENERAEQKAQELTQKLEQAGLRAPDQDIIVRTLGDDGGSGLRHRRGRGRRAGQGDPLRPARPTAPPSSAGGRSSPTAGSCSAGC